MKLKKTSQNLYMIANIFNIIEIAAAVILLIGGLVGFIVAPYVPETASTSTEIAHALARADVMNSAQVMTPIGGGLLVVGIVAAIFLRKANVWPKPKFNMNVVACVFGALSVNPFLVVAAILTIQAAKQDVDDGNDKNHIGMKAQKAITNTMSYIGLGIISVVWLIPFVFIVIQSLRIDPTGNVPLIFSDKFSWGFDNYLYLFSADTDFLLWYFNTFIIALSVSVISTGMQLMMAYTLSRFRFKMRKTLMNVMLILGMFPGFLTMIVLYQVLKSINLIQENAVGGLILVSVASSGMGYYVSKGFFDTVSKSLDEAARIDGATRFQIFYKIILPLAKPIVIYTILTGFMGPWGDFIFARVISMGEPTGYNVAVGLWNWLSQDQIANHYVHFCAGGVIVAIPVIVIFLFLQRYYVEGVTGGAVKG